MHDNLLLRKQLFISVLFLVFEAEDLVTDATDGIDPEIDPREVYMAGVMIEGYNPLIPEEDEGEAVNESMARSGFAPRKTLMFSSGKLSFL